jgi:sigma-54 specific flagellar transcriptional regulator A
VVSEGPVIRVSDLPPHLRPAGATAAPAPAPIASLPGLPESRPVFHLVERQADPVDLDGNRPVDLPGMLRRLEDAYIDAALAKTGGNRKAAADLLGLQRTTLVEKLRRRQREASIA